MLLHMGGQSHSAAEMMNPAPFLHPELMRIANSMHTPRAQRGRRRRGRHVEPDDPADGNDYEVGKTLCGLYQDFLPIRVFSQQTQMRLND